MSDWFDTLTKTLAHNTLSRRQAIGRIFGATAGIVLASWFPGQASASSEQNYHCSPFGSCNGSYVNCGSNKYNNCYCFQQMSTFSGVCACNSSCSSTTSCTATAQCPAGYACITNTGCTCTSGVCIHKCTQTCKLDSRGTGRTAVATY